QPGDRRPARAGDAHPRRRDHHGHPRPRRARALRPGRRDDRREARPRGDPCRLSRTASSRTTPAAPPEPHHPSRTTRARRGGAMPRITAPTVAEHRKAQQRALLDAAREILAETGRPPTFTALAERAGMARPSVYEYFR